jgi:hypothetical protein
MSLFTCGNSVLVFVKFLFLCDVYLLKPTFAQTYQTLCIDMFSHFFGGHYVSELNLMQASISPSLGGFGLRFFPAYHKANVKTQYDNLHMELGESLPSLEKLTENANSKLQSTISEVIDQVMIDKIMKSSKITIRDKARIMGCSTKYAAAWMISPPNSKKGKFLDNQAFGLLLCYWFGLPIFANNSKCHCGSSKEHYQTLQVIESSLLNR